MPPARAARRVPAPTTPAARVRAPAPAHPARRPSRSEPLSAAGPAVRLTPARTARPAAVPSIGGGGDPLPGPVRVQLEKSLRVDLRGVRVHTDAHAHDLAKSLSARAVSYGNHIFLAAGEQPTDIALIGHEVAHVVQQRAAPRLQAWNRGHTDSYEREAHQTADAVARRRQFTVHERTTGPRVQRLGISDALDYFADKANIIPGFRMFTIVLGVNPINMSSVDRSAANILRALIEFIPGGGLVTQALDNYGIFEKVGAWIQQQVAALGMVGSSFKQAVDDFLDSLSWTDIFDLGDVWRRAKRIFTAPIDQLISFAEGVISDILKFIKEAILKPLAALAEGTPAYDLLKAVLGEDPITGEPVAQDADALIGGFMKLIGQQEVYNNIKKANALPRAWAWFQGALGGLLGFVRQIPGLFIAALQSLELVDVVLPPRAFAKVGRVFASFFGQFLSWAGGQVLSLLQIIFEVVAPGAVPYVKKAAGAFKSIIENPIGFIGNLVKAGKQGFQQFASRFLTHLKKSLIDWLTGTLSGANIYIPQSFDFKELLKFVLSVLGLTWQNIRQKLVKAIGEPAVKAFETGFDIVVTLVRQGPAAAWDKIQEGLTNLKQMAMDAIMDYVKSKVVEEAVKKLVSFLSPVGAFIQAIIAIYNTIMFFVERLKQIARVAMAFIDSIAAIAAGSIGAAANKVEQTMGGLLTLVISFLARFAGLGKVSDAVRNLLNKVRTPIDKALDKVIAWIVAMAKKLGKFIAQAGVPQDPKERLRLGMQAAVKAAKALSRLDAAALTPVLAGVKVRYGFQSLVASKKDNKWLLTGTVNPTGTVTIPDAMTVVAAVAAIRTGQTSVTVRSREDALAVVHRAFPEALERPGAGVGAAYDSPDQIRLVKQYREDRHRLLVFHVDTQQYRVAEIMPHIEGAITNKQTSVNSANQALSLITDEIVRRQGRYSGPRAPGVRRDFTERIEALNERITGLQADIRQLESARRAFARNVADYQKLESEGVLYGHKDVDATSPHRTVPHINVEGPLVRVTRAGEKREFIDVTIYVASTP